MRKIGSVTTAVAGPSIQPIVDGAVLEIKALGDQLTIRYNAVSTPILTYTITNPELLSTDAKNQAVFNPGGMGLQTFFLEAS